MKRKDSPTQSFVRKWVKLYLQGVSAAELALSFDYSTTTISRGRRNSPKGVTHYNWRGGRSVVGKGYVKIMCPDHPRATGGYVLEHILKMEKKLGRPIGRDEVVHHKNGNLADNRLCNLELLSHSEHILLHQGVPLSVCREMWEVYKRGESLTRTAALFDVNTETVKNALRRLGKPLRSMTVSYALRNARQRKRGRWYKQKARAEGGRR